MNAAFSFFFTSKTRKCYLYIHFPWNVHWRICIPNVHYEDRHWLRWFCLHHKTPWKGSLHCFIPSLWAAEVIRVQDKLPRTEAAEHYCWVADIHYKNRFDEASLQSDELDVRKLKFLVVFEVVWVGNCGHWAPMEKHHTGNHAKNRKKGKKTTQFSYTTTKTVKLWRKYKLVSLHGAVQQRHWLQWQQFKDSSVAYHKK